LVRTFGNDLETDSATGSEADNRQSVTSSTLPPTRPLPTTDSPKYVIVTFRMTMNRIVIISIKMWIS
jgi:hypothetical protein